MSTLLDLLAAPLTVAAWWTTASLTLATAWTTHRTHEKTRRSHR